MTDFFDEEKITALEIENRELKQRIEELEKENKDLVDGMRDVLVVVKHCCPQLVEKEADGRSS